MSRVTRCTPARAVGIGVAALALLAAVPRSAEGQVRGSERALISQTSDGTTVTIDYARPHVRGREPVFGGLVHWGEVWTPGANQATTFESSSDVVLDGHSVPAGRYSVWLIPSESDWELVLEPNAFLYHTQPPAAHDAQIRLPVTPEEAEPTEALTFEFPRVDPQGMDLRFRWSTTSIDLRIDVPPTRVASVDADDAAPYLGRYSVAFAGPPPPGAPAGAAPPRMTVEVRHEGDRLLAALVGGPPAFPSEFALLPAAEGIFNPAWMMDGEIFETEVDMYFEFSIAEGTATGFDVRGLEDRLMMEGERIP